MWLTIVNLQCVCVCVCVCVCEGLVLTLSVSQSFCHFTTYLIDSEWPLKLWNWGQFMCQNFLFLLFRNSYSCFGHTIINCQVVISWVNHFFFSSLLYLLSTLLSGGIGVSCWNYQWVSLACFNSLVKTAFTSTVFIARAIYRHSDTRLDIDIVIPD